MHNNNYEPTSRVNYEHTTPNPYLHDTHLPPPPPAEYYMQQKTGKAWKIFIPVVLLVFGLILGILFYPVISSSYHNATTAKPTTFVPFALPPTKTAITPTTITKVYDAAAIMGDLQQAGMQAANIQYGVPACGSKIAGVQSEACFRNASLCNLQCDEDSVWIAVFDNPQDAQLDYQQWMQSDGPVPSIDLSGHCVVAGNFINGTYAKIIAYDCR